MNVKIKVQYVSNITSNIIHRMTVNIIQIFFVLLRKHK